MGYRDPEDGASAMFARLGVHQIIRHTILIEPWVSKKANKWGLATETSGHNVHDFVFLTLLKYKTMLCILENITVTMKSWAKLVRLALS